MKTQAWGWLVAGVLAAGLNASYHDSGLEWAHRVVERFENRTGPVLALATGRVDEFLARTRMVLANDETASCRLATMRARVQTRIAGTQTRVAVFEAMSDREQAQMDRIEANRARIEAQIARIRIPDAAFNPVVFRSVRTPEINIPKIRVPQIHVPRIRVPAVSIPEVSVRTTCPRVRVNEMYLAAFSRPAKEEEIDAVLGFAEQQGEEMGIETGKRMKDLRVWSDVGHALINTKEFIFVE
jgi:hypothetical protein